ncbi:MAG: hypothetical protein GF331_14155, partial [Chitinivibrionales bacterium]|nr:hypothetical protein [Chitinivibrionales bacterium]
MTRIATVLPVLLLVPVAVSAQGGRPHGDTGIAASYPGDSGIAADDRVVFAEDFEHVSGPSLSASNSGFDVVYGPNSI